MSSSKNISGIFYSLAAICILLFAFFSWKQKHDVSGWFLMAFFLCIAFAFRSSKTLKGLSYTMMILAAVSIAMYHPQYFKTIGDYKLSALIIPLLQIIMFGMGTELSLKDFANVIRMPKGIIIGVVGHYIIMPLVGFALARYDITLEARPLGQQPTSMIPVVYWKQKELVTTQKNMV